MGLIIFFVFLKFLAEIASGIVASSAGAPWFDVTGELQVRTLETSDGTGQVATISLNPLAYVKMALRLVFWQELIFQEIPPFGNLLGVGLSIMSGWAVLAEFKSDASNAFGRVLGGFRGGV